MKRLIVLAFIVAMMALPSYAQVAVIVNKSVPVATAELSKISDIYLLNTKTWGNGTSIAVFWLRGSENVEEAVSASLGMRLLDLRKVWLRVQLSGDGKAPTTVTTEEDMLQRVAETRGAIGFVSLSKVTPAVRVIAVIE